MAIHREPRRSSRERPPLRALQAKLQQITTTIKSVATQKTKLPHDPHSKMNNLVRTSIPQTIKKRQAFLIHHEKLVKPLLPTSNFYTKLSKDDVAEGVRNGFIPFKEITQQPSLIKNGQMKQYQLHGLSFLSWLHDNGIGGILGDEMGLGKTLQTLSLFAHLRESGVQGPFLVICPLSVLAPWMNEIANWVPSFKAIRFHGTGTERERLKTVCKEKEYDVYVTSYEQFVLERFWFAHRVWRYVVVDEGHCLKNDQTQLAHAVGTLNAEYRLLLTGTPLQNSLHELWALFHFLYPDVFNEKSADAFKDAFNLTKGTYDTKFIEAASALLSKLMLRRMKVDMDEIKLPPKEELLVYVPLTPLQRFWYKRMITRLDTGTLNEVVHGTAGVIKPDVTAEEKVDQVIAERRSLQTKTESAENTITQRKDPADTKSNAWQKLMNLLMQLRKICNHPYLLPNSEPEPFELGEHIVLGSGKFMLLDKLMPKLFAEGHRVLLFSGFTSMLDICEDYFVYRGWKYARLDGSTTRPRRALDIRLFNQKNSPYQCYLISTKAGGLGVNLTGADTVIFLDSDFNPQIQAMARCHRIGQTKPVTVYRLVSQDSVEEQALTRLAKKLYLSVKVTSAASGTSTDDKAPTFTKNELVKLLRGGTTALAAPIGDDWAQKPIEEILKESRERQRKREDMLAMTDEEVETMEKEYLKDQERIRTNIFEGKVLSRTNREITDEWKDLAKRARVERTVMIDGFSLNRESLLCNDWEAFPTFSANYVKPEKRKRREIDHQDWCQHCRDGGEVVLCSGCPRVFHAECAGYTKDEVSKMPLFYCPQHNCSVCWRNTTNCGGMLFRCQTCPDAFWYTPCESGVDGSEDCLPADGEIEGIGASLPELEILGYPETKQGYYIRCPDCVARFAKPKDEEERHWTEGWKRELASANKKWETGDLETEEKEVVQPVAKKIKMQISKPTPSPKKDWLDNWMKKMSPHKSMNVLSSPKKGLSSFLPKGMSMVRPTPIQYPNSKIPMSSPKKAVAGSTFGSTKAISAGGNPNQFPRIANHSTAMSSPKKKVVAGSIFGPKTVGNPPHRIANPKIATTRPKSATAGSSKDASPSTITTQEEEFLEDDDVFRVVRELHVGKARDVIVID